MSTMSVILKTHNKTDLSNAFDTKLNNCIVHNQKPEIFDVVAGKRKEHHYIASCKNHECGKISMISAEDVVEIWNRWNKQANN